MHTNVCFQTILYIFMTRCYRFPRRPVLMKCLIKGMRIQLLTLMVFFLFGCHNEKISQIYSGWGYLAIELEMESSYCIPNSIVMVGMERDSSNWHLYGEGPVEGLELVRIITPVGDSLRIYMERTHLKDDVRDTSFIVTEVLLDSVVHGGMDAYKSLYRELLNLEGSFPLMSWKHRRPGELYDSRAFFIMSESECKEISLYKKTDVEKEVYGQSYKVVLDLFSRYEELMGLGK